MRYSNSQCKRCGSSRVAWVESKRTGRPYLAFAEVTGPLSKMIHRSVLHDCADPAKGGYDPCPLCGRNHWQRPGQPLAAVCERYPGTIPSRPKGA